MAHGGTIPFLTRSAGIAADPARATHALLRLDGGRESLCRVPVEGLLDETRLELAMSYDHCAGAVVHLGAFEAMVVCRSVQSQVTGESPLQNH